MDIPKVRLVAAGCWLFFTFIEVGVGKVKQIVSDTYRTMVQNSHKYRLKYWATRSSIHSFVRTAHLFVCSALLASLACSAALTRLLTPELTPELVGQ